MRDANASFFIGGAKSVYMVENKKHRNKYIYLGNKKYYKNRTIIFSKNRPNIRNKIFKRKKGHG